ncbi:MAG: sulfatase [Myxococcales bacterium]|nr:sulfatase [Myxococcales bacterium]
MLLACGDGAPERPPNLVLFIADSLRNDAVDCIAARGRTPYLCGLAERGVRFEAAYAAAPWTVPSAVSLFTGAHAAGYAREEGFRVPDDEVLLAEALGSQGYEALSFVEGRLPRAANALQGFSEPSLSDRRPLFLELHQRMPDAREALTDMRFHRYLGALRYLLDWQGEPFALLLWSRDPQAQYTPPARMLVDQLRVHAGRVPRPIHFYLRLGNPIPGQRAVLSLERVGPELTPAEIELLVQLYHLEVQSVDDRLGRVLELLRVQGIEDETFVVFTSDHGEGFGAHGHFQHGNSLYEELLRVPLVMAGPGLPQGVAIRERVSHVDLAPTLAELLGVACCAGAQGRSLLSLLSGVEAEGRIVYAGSPEREGARNAVIEGDHKLIVRSSGEIELYDLASDLDEREDLAGRRARVAAQLRARLEEVRQANEERRLALRPAGE